MLDQFIVLDSNEIHDPELNTFVGRSLSKQVANVLSTKNFVGSNHVAGADTRLNIDFDVGHGLV